MWTTLLLGIVGGSSHAYSGSGFDPCGQYSQPLQYLTAEVTYDGAPTPADSLIVTFGDGAIADMVNQSTSYSSNYGDGTYGMYNPGGTCTATATVGQVSETLLCQDHQEDGNCGAVHVRFSFELVSPGPTGTTPTTPTTPTTRGPQGGSAAIESPDSTAADTAGKQAVEGCGCSSTGNVWGWLLAGGVLALMRRQQRGG